MQRFASECVGCSQSCPPERLLSTPSRLGGAAVRPADMRFLVPILATFLFLTGCQSTRPELPHQSTGRRSHGKLLLYNPLGWRVVTVAGRMSGRLRCPRSMATISPSRICGPARRVPILRELSSLWLHGRSARIRIGSGAKIPSTPQSVEFVSISLRQSPSYQRYEGSELKLVNNTDGDAMRETNRLSGFATGCCHALETISCCSERKLRKCRFHGKKRP